MSRTYHRNQKPLTLYLEPELLEKLAADAKLRGTSMSALGAQLIESHYKGIDIAVPEKTPLARLEDLERRVRAIEQRAQD